jgi:nucleoside transporter
MSTAPAPSMVGTRLSAMMFLQFFVWGAWYVSMTGWMREAHLENLTPWAYSVGPLAAIASPFFLGLIADRFFATQRVLALMHVLGGGFLLAIPLVIQASDASVPASFTHPYVLLLLGHMLCYMPTLGLTNTISFAHIKNAEREFPLIRVYGTIGWIAGNIAVSALPGGDRSPYQFVLAGGAAIVLGLYCATLPHTPPPAAGREVKVGEILGADSLSLLARPSYLVFILCSFLICIPLAGYYNEARNFVEYAGFAKPTFTMSFGQMSEILFMLVMPLFFVRLGVKWMLGVGMLAWVTRYGLFAAAADTKIGWMVVAGILLHGICYDFFFVTGQVYVDSQAHPRIRGQAQGFLVLVTQGIGMLIGAQIMGRVKAANTTVTSAGTLVDWRAVWLLPCGMAAVILLVFLVLFRNAKQVSAAAVEGG